MKGKKGNRLRLSTAATVAAVLLASTAAQSATIGTYSVNPTSDDGLAIPGFYPNARVDLIYDDNLLRSDTDKLDSFALRLAPEALWVQTRGKHLFRVGYQGEYAWHEASSNEDYYDHFLGTDANLDLGPKLDLNLLASYRLDHEPRGGAGTINLAPEPNRWDEWIAAATVVYGRRIAKAQVTGAVEYRNRDYTNNAQFPRDHDDLESTLTVYYNLGSKTHIVLEPSYVDMSYPNSDRDNKVARFLAGLTWSFTAKTMGEVKVGWVDKEYDQPIYPDNSGLGIDASVTWRPKSYSVVTVAASRDIYDSNAGFDTQAGALTTSFEALLFTLDWEHGLTRLTDLQTGLSYENDDFDTGRDDTLWGLYLGLTHQLRRSVEISARYEFSARDTSEPTVSDFEDNRLVLGLQTSFE